MSAIPDMPVHMLAWMLSRMSESELRYLLLTMGSNRQGIVSLIHMERLIPEALDATAREQHAELMRRNGK